MTIKVIIDKLTNGEAELCTTDLRFDEMYTFMNEQEAMALICSLVKVFQVPNSDIEVIHFPAGANKAECLRNAADLLDKNGETEVSCPPYWDLDFLEVRDAAEQEVLAGIDSCEATWESENGA